jgi:hypothetical protein
MELMFWQSPKVTFATSCWEKDWRFILETEGYLEHLQIKNHAFPFSEKILIINNVLDLEEVQRAAQKKIEQKVIDRYVVVAPIAEEVLSFFHLTRDDFRARGDEGVPSDWIYYNALSPLTALYVCQTEYLLYMTGDVRLKKKVNWIPKALKKMEKSPCYKLANLCWNEKYQEAKRESYKRSFYFYMAKEGFSDQMFLVKTSDFRAPIYGEIRSDSSHYPRGYVFERRAFSHMKNQDPPWERLTYRWKSYQHENIR